MSWQDTVLDNVHRASRRTQRYGPGLWVGLLLRVHPDIRIAIRKIAQQRDVAMSTYLRRLVVMAIANETGDPLAKWLDKCPEPMEYGMKHIHGLTQDVKSDTGVEMEGMCTHPGCGEIHW